MRMVLAAAAMAAAASAAAEYPITDLVAAARRGDLHAVHRLLGDGAATDVRDARGFTALHWAALRGHWRVVDELVEAGAPVNAAAADGSTPLHGACHHDRPEPVRLLLDAGADPRGADVLGLTPLHVAARRGCIEVAALLLSRGADPNALTRDGRTPLNLASDADHRAVVELLLALDAGSRQADPWGLAAAAPNRRRQPPVAVDSAVLDDFVGLFAVGQDTVKVWRRGNELAIRVLAPDALLPVGADLFACRREPWIVRFVRGPGAAVVGLEISSSELRLSGPKLPSPRYVGARACAACHSEAGAGHQYIAWLRSRHGHAYWRLAADWALVLGRFRPQYADLESPREDERCRLCHVTGAQDEDALFAESFRAEEGVGCESCHGPGSEYADPAVMSDRAAFLEHGGRIPDAATCRSCHRNSERFDFATWWPRIEHPRPDPGTSAPDAARR